MIEFIIDNYQQILIWLGVVSFIATIPVIFLIPIIIKNMPKDYFVNDKYRNIRSKNIKQSLIFAIKNVIGFILLIIGIIAMFVPGQGLVIMVIGLFIMNFKGKYKLEQHLIKKDMVFNTLNWLRKKTDAEPFVR